jgi:hypothetical protein
VLSGNKLIKEGNVCGSILDPCEQNLNSAHSKGVPVCNFTFNKNCISHRRSGLGIKEGNAKTIARPTKIGIQKESLLTSPSTPMAQYTGTGPCEFALCTNFYFILRF